MFDALFRIPLIILAAFLFPALGAALAGKFLAFFGPVIAGPITYILARRLLNAKKRLDDLPPFAKRVVVFLVAAGITAIFSYFGQPLPVECAAVATGDVPEECWTALTGGTALKGLIVAGVAMYLHSLKKSNPRT